MNALRVVSTRGQSEVAVLLMQNGIDTAVRNAKGQTALELARDAGMRQLLEMQPIRDLQRTAQRFEGRLLKVCVCVCVCEGDRARDRQNTDSVCARMSVCVEREKRVQADRHRQTDRLCVCVCVRERERETDRQCVCAYECVRGER